MLKKILVKGEQRHSERAFPNFEKYFAALILCISVFLAALLIPRGPGCDGDFPRHVVNGAWMLEHSSLRPYNGPPFPLMDFTSEVIQKIGTLPNYSMNILAFMCFLGSVLVGFGIAKAYRKRGIDVSPMLFAASIAAHPVILIAGGTAGDYGFSLFFTMWAWFSVLNRKMEFAPLALGIASGMRISNCVWGLPLTLLVFTDVEGTVFEKVKSAVRFASAALISGILVWYGHLVMVGLDVGHFILTHGGAEASSELRNGYWPNIKAGLSKAVNLSTIPLWLFLAFSIFRKWIQKDWKNILFRPEVWTALALEYLLFLYLPSDPGYIITTIPVATLVFMSILAKKVKSVIPVSFFVSNFAVLSLQFGIPTLFHLGTGYYVGEYTCQNLETGLEPFRFSIPRDQNGHEYYPVGDPTTDARYDAEKRFGRK